MTALVEEAPAKSVEVFGWMRLVLKQRVNELVLEELQIVNVMLADVNTVPTFEPVAPVVTGNIRLRYNVDRDSREITAKTATCLRLGPHTCQERGIWMGGNLSRLGNRATGYEGHEQKCVSHGLKTSASPLGNANEISRGGP